MKKECKGNRFFFIKGVKGILNIAFAKFLALLIGVVFYLVLAFPAAFLAQKKIIFFRPARMWECELVLLGLTVLFTLFVVAIDMVLFNATLLQLNIQFLNSLW